MNSWERLACYPQGSFYPLSDGLSTQYHRITNSDFRLCSTCWSRSQAPFCLCTLRPVSVRPEGTFGRLRYSFGGDRPSQTACLRGSAGSLLLALESQQQKGGIPTSAPHRPRAMLRRLPPILCICHRDSISSCSEAPWGLSVQSRVTCIFTGISISPGPSLRQCPNHYAFQASAPILQLSLSQAPVFLVNSCLGLFSAAPFSSERFCSSLTGGHPSP